MRSNSESGVRNAFSIFSISPHARFQVQKRSSLRATARLGVLLLIQTACHTTESPAKSPQELRFSKLTLSLFKDKKEMKTNRHSKEAIRKQVEEEMKKEFTFRPRLISRQRRFSTSDVSDR